VALVLSLFSRIIMLLAPWRSGYAEVCKTFYTGSIPVGASSLKIRASGGTVYTRDLKSLAFTGLWVQIPPRPPRIIYDENIARQRNPGARPASYYCVCIYPPQIWGVEKVFLPLRAATKKFLPNVYELPGGHIDFGEEIVVGLKREIQEEIGKEVTVGDSLAAFTYTNPIKGSHSIEVVYFAQFIGDAENIQLDPEDYSGYRWIAEDEIDSLPVRDSEDPERAIIARGFALLKGAKPNFA
jgi:8-oxo-dGTP pyrophosphatase MutT (NUDIX family)